MRLLLEGYTHQRRVSLRSEVLEDFFFLLFKSVFCLQLFCATFVLILKLFLELKQRLILKFEKQGESIFPMGQCYNSEWGGLSQLSVFSEPLCLQVCGKRMRLVEEGMWRRGVLSVLRPHTPLLHVQGPHPQASASLGDQPAC